MVPTLQGFRKRKSGEFTQLVRRFRGRETTAPLLNEVISWHHPCLTRIFRRTVEIGIQSVSSETFSAGDAPRPYRNSNWKRHTVISNHFQTKSDENFVGSGLNGFICCRLS